MTCSWGRVRGQGGEVSVVVSQLHFQRWREGGEGEGVRVGTGERSGPRKRRRGCEGVGGALETTGALCEGGREGERERERERERRQV